VLLFLVSCGSEESKATAENAAPKNKNASATTLRLNLQNEPRTLDPNVMTDLVGSVVMGALMEPLVYNDAKGVPQPRAAERWEHDKEFRTWTFYLRKDGRWHNGDPVKAQDFKYGIERLLTPATQAQYATYVLGFLPADEFYNGGGLQSGKSLDCVQVLDDHTIQYTLRNPTPFFSRVIQLFCWLPLHKPTIDQHGATWANKPETFMGNGAFKLESYRSRDVIVAKKNPDYWAADKIFWEEIRYFMIDNETTEDAAFRAGDLDITATVAIPEMDYWRGKPEYHPYNFFGMYYLALNHRRELFTDVRVRKALALAIDRELITKRVTRREEPPAQGIVPGPLASPRGGDYRTHAGDLIGTYNPAEAKRLLAEAGYGPGGKPFPAIEYIYSTSEENKAIAEQVQAMWRQNLGIDVRLQNVEWGVRLSRTQSGDYDICFSNWYGDYLDPMTFLELFTSDSTYNISAYKSPAYDEAIAAARKEVDPIKREDFMIAGEQWMIREDMAVAPLFGITKPILIQQGIEGVTREATGGYIYIHGRRR
jgi:oligopeptide transport system substrate-binding protein